MKKGFTLAEVLITLGIIGVVVAMTLPALISNHKNSELRSSLLKNYSAISQALDMYQADTGERITPSNCKARELKSILVKYINVAGDCGFTFGATNNPYCVDSKKFYTNYLNTSFSPSFLYDDGHFILADGSLVLLENEGTRLYISVDINGYNKKPNRSGYDLFMFQINDKGKLIPMGASGSDFLNCGSKDLGGGNGLGCTTKALTYKDYFKKLPK